MMDLNDRCKNPNKNKQIIHDAHSRGGKRKTDELSVGQAIDKRGQNAFYW